MSDNVIELHPGKRKKRNNFINFLSRNFIFILILFFLGYIVYGIGSPVLQTKELNNEIAAVEKEIELAKQENEQLKEKIALLKTNEYIERVAREKLGFVKPGEIIIVPAEVGKPKELDKQTPLY